MAITSPYKLLHGLDQRCRKNASGLPSASAVVDDWVGIGFSLNKVALLAKMDDINEILPMPETIRIPGVLPWVIGLANIRGSLMPILDMNAFVYGETTKVTKKSRILIINKMGIIAGLIVDEVYGLRRFKLEEHQQLGKKDADSIGEFLSGIFIDQVRRWSVFSVEKLARADKFIRIV